MFKVKNMTKNKIKEYEKEIIDALPIEVVIEESEKDKLLKLYETLKTLNVNSISDLENLISRAE